MMTVWSYREAHVQANVLPSARILLESLPPESSIYLLTLEKNELKLTRSEQSEASDQLIRERIHWIPTPYFPFGFRSILSGLLMAIRLSFFVNRKRIEVIHSWCTPAGAIGFVISLLTRKSLLIDSYEPHAESMTENGTWSRRGPAFRMLFLLERLQSKRAKVVIGATKGMLDYALVKYGVNLSNRYFVKPACVDLELFSLNKRKNQTLMMQLGLTNKIVCVIAGQLGGIYFDHEVFDFLKCAKVHWGDRFRAILLMKLDKEQLKYYCHDADIDPSIIYCTYVRHEEVPMFMGLADFAVTHVKPVPSKRYCTPIKNGEYWAMGLPVVTPQGISDDSDIIERENIGVVLKSMNPKGYQEGLTALDALLGQSSDQHRLRIRGIAQRFRGMAVGSKAYSQAYSQMQGSS